MLEAAQVATQNTRPSSAEVIRDTRRANQGPAIHDAQVTADAGLAQPPIGAGMEWYTPTPPPGWLLQHGQEVSKLQYPDLFLVLGTTWNDGTESADGFRLPDRRGRAGVGSGDGGANLTTRTLTDRFGTELVTLTSLQMPEHGHAINVQSNTHRHGGDTYTNINYTRTNALSGTYTLANDHSYSSDSTNDDTHAHDASASRSGGDQPHQNLPPSIVVNFIIRATL